MTEAKTARPRREVAGREGLLRTAVRLFARRGFAGASIRDIAEAAGCGVANVYHHFANKEALWLAILERSVGDMPERLRAALDEGVDPLDRLERLMRAHLAISDAFLLESHIFFIGEDRLSDAGNAANRALQRAVLDLYGKAVGAVFGAPADADTIRHAALNTLGVINWRLRWARPGATAAVRRAEADAVVGFVLGGLGARTEVAVA